MSTTEATYLGLDLETTGIDETTGLILELGMIAYDSQLNPLASFHSLVNADTYAAARADGRVSEFVEKMHTDNGLWHDLATVDNPADTAPATVEAAALAWIENNGLERLPMLGNSMTLDRSFLAVHMPRLLAAFHYRSVDATSLCLVAQHTVGFNPADYLPDSSTEVSEHRVLADVQRSADLVKAFLAGMRATN